jgi:hypothetical protein
MPQGSCYSEPSGPRGHPVSAGGKYASSSSFVLPSPEIDRAQPSLAGPTKHPSSPQGEPNANRLVHAISRRLRLSIYFNKRNVGTVPTAFFNLTGKFVVADRPRSQT